MLRIASAIDRLNNAIGRAVSWLALGMVLVGSFNALARFLDKGMGSALSSNTWLEAQWYMFAALFLFAAPWALRQDAHVRVDLLYARLSPRGRAWINLLGVLLLLLPFCVFMLWAVWPSVVDSWIIREMSPDPGGLPRWPIRAAVPAAVGLLLMQGIALGLRSLAVLRGAAPPERPQERPTEGEGHL